MSPPIRQVYAFHPAGVTSATWDDVAAALGEEFALSAPDLNLLSAATGPDRRALARALAAAAPDGELILTGGLAGANLAIEVAALLGERARGVLLLNPVVLTPEVKKGLEGFVALSHMWSEEMIASLLPMFLWRYSPTWSRNSEKLAAMFRVAGGPMAQNLMLLEFPPPAEIAPRVRCPIRALFGAQSVNPLLPNALAMAGWSAHLEEGAVRIVEDAAHFLTLERPDAVAAALRELAG